MLREGRRAEERRVRRGRRYHVMSKRITRKTEQKGVMEGCMEGAGGQKKGRKERRKDGWTILV